ETAQHGGAAGAEHLDLDAARGLERLDDLVGRFDRRRGVPDHLAFFLRRFDVNSVCRRCCASERNERRQRDEKGGSPARGHGFLQLIFACYTGSAVSLSERPKTLTFATSTETLTVSPTLNCCFGWVCTRSISPDVSFT